MASKEFKREYNKALREGDTKKATEIYQEAAGKVSEEVSESQSFEDLNGVGPELADELGERFNSYSELEEASKEDLEDISGVGEGRAESILEQV